MKPVLQKHAPYLLGMTSAATITQIILIFGTYMHVQCFVVLRSSCLAVVVYMSAICDGRNANIRHVALIKMFEE